MQVKYFLPDFLMIILVAVYTAFTVYDIIMQLQHQYEEHAVKESTKAREREARQIARERRIQAKEQRMEQRLLKQHAKRGPKNAEGTRVAAAGGDIAGEADMGPESRAGDPIGKALVWLQDHVHGTHSNLAKAAGQAAAEGIEGNVTGDGALQQRGSGSERSSLSGRSGGQTKGGRAGSGGSSSSTSSTSSSDSSGSEDEAKLLKKLLKQYEGQGYETVPGEAHC